MKKIMQKVVLVTLVLAMMMLFWGCNNNLPAPNEQVTGNETQSNSNIEENVSEDTSEIDKEALEGKITVAVPAGNYTDFLNNSIIPAFNEEYPNVVVETIIDENIDTRIAAGDVPNVMAGVFGFMPAKYAKMDLLVDYKSFSDYKAEFDKVSSEFIVENYNGLYYMPWNATTQMMIFNKDLFREAGLDPENPPRTFDEYLIAAQKISELPDREDGSKVYGSVMWNDALSWGGWYWTMLSQIYYNFNDGQYQLFNEYGTDVVIDEEGANMAGFLEFMANVQETAPPTMEMNFFSRNIGMWLQYGYGWKNNLKEAAGQPMVIGEDVGVAPIPTLTADGKHWSTLDGRALLIFKTDENQEMMSWEFVKFLMREDHNLAACKELGQLPTLKALKADEFFQSAENKPFVEQLANTIPNEPIAEVDQVANIILQVYSEVVIDKSLTPEEAVQKIAEESRKLLEE